MSVSSQRISKGDSTSPYHDVIFVVFFLVVLFFFLVVILVVLGSISVVVIIIFCNVAPQSSGRRVVFITIVCRRLHILAFDNIVLINLGLRIEVLAIGLVVRHAAELGVALWAVRSQAVELQVYVNERSSNTSFQLLWRGNLQVTDDASACDFQGGEGGRRKEKVRKTSRWAGAALLNAQR